MEININNYFFCLFKNSPDKRFIPPQIFYDKSNFNIAEYCSEEIKTIYKIDPNKINIFSERDDLINIVNKNYKSVYMPKIINDIKQYKIDKDKIEIKYHNNKFWYKSLYPIIQINELENNVICRNIPVKKEYIETFFNFAKSISKVKIAQKFLFKVAESKEGHIYFNHIADQLNNLISKNGFLFSIMANKIFKKDFIKNIRRGEELSNKLLFETLDTMTESILKNIKKKENIEENIQNTDKQLFEECVRELENDFLIIDGELWQSGYMPFRKENKIILNEISFLEKEEIQQSIITKEIDGIEIYNKNLIEDFSQNLIFKKNIFNFFINDMYKTNELILKFVKSRIKLSDKELEDFNNNIDLIYKNFFHIINKAILKNNLENIDQYIIETIEIYQNLKILKFDKEQTKNISEVIKKNKTILEDYKSLPISFENENTFKL